MEKQYRAGDGPGPVSIRVEVGSPVPSVTLVYRVVPGNPNQVFATSDPVTGNVGESPIGEPAGIHDTRVVSQSTFLCSTLDPGEWQHVPNVISVHYTLEGGADGTVAFAFNPEDVFISETGKVIVVTKYIRIL
jgi:hypothetical protein